MSKNHVAVIAFPFATHAGLLYGLVQRLANSLPNVTFTFFSTNKSNSSIFTTPQNCDSTNIKPYDIPDGVPEGHVGGVEQIIGLFFKSAKKNLQNAIASAEDDSGRKITCIMADAFMWFSGEISEELNVSWIPVWTSAAGSLSVHVETDLIRENVESQGDIYNVCWSSWRVMCFNGCIFCLCNWPQLVGKKDAALANAISNWINLLLLPGYVRISPSCKNTWTGFS